MRWLPLLLAALAAAVAPELAGACSCADLDPRDRLEAGDPALIGKVIEEILPAVPPSAGGTEPPRYLVRVERQFNARLPRELTLKGDNSSCSFSWRVGQRVGAFLRRTSSGWATHLCNLANPADLERALRRYPRPVGRGQLALLAGGQFGDARLMALDRRGRILGYGFGRGSVREISVCPGGRAAAELVDVGTGRSLVAVRSLETLAVASQVAVSRDTREVVCADPAGSAVYSAALHYSGRPVKGRLTAMRIAGSTATTVVDRPAEQVALGAGAVYAWSGGRLLELSLTDGSTRTLLRGRLFDGAAVSADGSHLALWSFDNRLRVIDLATGAIASRRTRLAGELAWLAADRLLVRVGGTARVFDDRLQPVRSYRFYRAEGQAHVDGTVFGTDHYRLVGLDLESGRKRTVARLPDRGVGALVGVPGGPAVDLPRRTPRTGGVSVASHPNVEGPLWPLASCWSSTVAPWTSTTRCWRRWASRPVGPGRPAPCSTGSRKRTTASGSRTSGRPKSSSTASPKRRSDRSRPRSASRAHRA